jgi:hypothetical protein
MSHTTRLTLDLGPELYRQLKELAVLRGVSLLDVCLDALRNEIAGKHVIALPADHLLADLWDNEVDAIYDDGPVVLREPQDERE